MDIDSWLRSLGLEQYEATFRDNAIDGMVLPRLTAEDLKDLGVGLVGHRRTLLDAIAALRGDANEKEPPSEALPHTPASSRASAPPSTVAPAAEPVGERRYLTVMFCDLVGSTSISAQLDAEEWRDLVGAYLDAASAAVTEMGGHVAKKLGDGLMALFGYPVAHENDAERAARAALSIQRALAELNRKNAGTGKPSSPPASASKPARRCSMRRARFTATSPTSRRGCRRWPSRARSWSRRGCSVRSPGCLWRKSAARTRSKGVPEPTALFRLVRASGGGRRSGQRNLTPLVGRDEEIAVLMRRWERARQGEGQLVLIVGEPGLGKSRLIEEFHMRLEGDAAHLESNGPAHSFCRTRRCTRSPNGAASASAAPTCRQSGGWRTWKTRWRRSSSIRRRTPLCWRRCSIFRCPRNARRRWRRRNCAAGNWRR